MSDCVCLFWDWQGGRKYIINTEVDLLILDDFTPSPDIYDRYLVTADWARAQFYLHELKL